MRRSDHLPDMPMDDVEHTSRLVLEGIQLHWGRVLEQEGWHGLAQSLRAKVDQSLHSMAFCVSVRTMLLGLTDVRRHVEWPATWQQHLKQRTLRWLGRESPFPWPPDGWRWCVERWLHRKLGNVRMASEDVQVYRSACPHISAGGNHHPQLCIDYFHRMQGRGYDGADFLLSQAHAVLFEALEPVLPPDQPFDAFRQTQALDSAARRVLELLREAMEATE